MSNGDVLVILQHFQNDYIARPDLIQCDNKTEQAKRFRSACFFIQNEKLVIAGSQLAEVLFHAQLSQKGMDYIEQRTKPPQTAVKLFLSKVTIAVIIGVISTLIVSGIWKLFLFLFPI